MLSNEHPALSLPQEQSLHMPIEDRPGSLCRPERSGTGSTEQPPDPAGRRRVGNPRRPAHDARAAGYQLTCTTSLQVALAAITRETFPSVLTDLYLEATTSAYRLGGAARACKPGVPVILLTGRPSFAGAHERCAAAGGDPGQTGRFVAGADRLSPDHQESELTRRNQDSRPRTRCSPPCCAGDRSQGSHHLRHAERVVHYADMLAQRCGVDREDRDSLRLASLLHDVGKIGVPDGILTKPARDPERTRADRAAPAEGYEILEPLSYHENVRTWVYQHHERWDGKATQWSRRRRSGALGAPDPGRGLRCAGGAALVQGRLGAAADRRLLPRPGRPALRSRPVATWSPTAWNAWAAASSPAAPTSCSDLAGALAAASPQANDGGREVLSRGTWRLRGAATIRANPLIGLGSAPRTDPSFVPAIPAQKPHTSDPEGTLLCTRRLRALRSSLLPLPLLFVAAANAAAPKAWLRPARRPMQRLPPLPVAPPPACPAGSCRCPAAGVGRRARRQAVGKCAARR